MNLPLVRDFLFQKGDLPPPPLQPSAGAAGRGEVVVGVDTGAGGGGQ